MRGKTPLTQNFVKTSAELRQNFGRPSTDLHQTEIVQVILDQLLERDHHLLPHHHTRVRAVLGHKESNDGLGCLPPELGLVQDPDSEVLHHDGDGSAGWLASSAHQNLPAWLGPDTCRLRCD